MGTVLDVAERRPTVHALVGLPGAGKTTLARRLASNGSAVRFSLDEWMLRLYTLPYDAGDYVRLLPACQALMLDLASQVLAAGTDVVLDWNHFSPEKRAASAAWADVAEAQYVVHHVTTTLEDARQRLAMRTEQRDASSHPIHPEDLEHSLTFLIPPSEEEGHQIERHGD